MNRPYEGTVIPERFYKKNYYVQGIRTGVNRKLFLEERSGVMLKTGNFRKIRKMITGLIEDIREFPEF